MTGASAEIVACCTCGGASDEADARSRGEHLLELLRRERDRRGDVGVEIVSVRCLWACKRSCAVMLRSVGRVGYVIVDLEPNDTSARALLDYATSYLHSADGAVPFKTWPAALKGHFHCRIPQPSDLGAASPGSAQEPSS